MFAVVSPCGPISDFDDPRSPVTNRVGTLYSQTHSAGQAPQAISCRHMKMTETSLNSHPLSLQSLGLKGSLFVCSLCKIHIIMMHIGSYAKSFKGE